MSLTPPDSPPEPVRQLSLFGTEAADPSVADLAGLLAGPGEVGRMGRTARLSIAVDAAWRVHVLVAELGLRGLAASWEATEDQRYAVRTSYARTLAPLATAWLVDAGRKRPPAHFHLNGRRLRLWLAAAGRPTRGVPARARPGDQDVVADGAGGARRRGSADGGVGARRRPAGLPDRRPSAVDPAGRAGRRAAVGCPAGGLADPGLTTGSGKKAGACKIDSRPARWRHQGHRDSAGSP
ncbi:hypothetical protein [Micromonospora sp. 4G55]|uniref:hypothetical protein n=1 Tax=Micromonospora sp. 4G55 TaxID=2806102 RepID=UPI0035C6AF48